MFCFAYSWTVSGPTGAQGALEPSATWTLSAPIPRPYIDRACSGVESVHYAIELAIL